MSNLKNLVCSKIPMDWFSIPEEKGGGKAKRIELSNLKSDGGAPIYYTIRTKWPEGYELSQNFDQTLVNAIRAMANKRHDKIVVKNVRVGYSGKQWMYPTDGCEIIVVDAVKKVPIFKETVSGKNPEKPKEEESNSLGVTNGPIEESMGELPDGSGFMTGTIKEWEKSSPEKTKEFKKKYSNSIKNGIRESKSLMEGTWAISGEGWNNTCKSLRNIITYVNGIDNDLKSTNVVSILKSFEDKHWNEIGDDEFYDDIDGAIKFSKENKMDAVKNSLSDAMGRLDELRKQFSAQMKMNIRQAEEHKTDNYNKSITEKIIEEALTGYNNYGLDIYNWENNIHPDNNNFMQNVFWKADFNPSTGKYKIGFNLANGTKVKWIEYGQCNSKEELKNIIENSKYYKTINEKDNFFSKNFIIKINNMYVMDYTGTMTADEKKAYNFSRYKLDDIKERLKNNDVTDYKIIWL